jgi:broad-specificity NMP kinase
MGRICPQCGAWCKEENVDQKISAAICLFCNYAQQFLQLPLFYITGPSGAGKSTLSLHLPSVLPECVTLDTDILWGALPATKEDNYRDYHNHWLIIAENIGQSGRPVVLCGAATPEQIAGCSHYPYFSAVHFLALVCNDNVLVERLKQRPAWRKSSTEEFLEQMISFNCWLKSNAEIQKMMLYDTTHRTIEQTIADISAWVHERLPQRSS